MPLPFEDFRHSPIKMETKLESLCLDLWKIKWVDPGAKKNGRKGQKQYGVDVYGRPGNGIVYEGVQAKAYGRMLTNDEIDKEVKQADKFDKGTGPLSRLTIVVAAASDANAQAHVRTVTRSRLKDGKFPVDLMSWDDLIDELTSSSDAYASELEGIRDKYFVVMSQSQVVADKVLEGLTGLAAPAQTLLEQTRATEQALELDNVRDLLNSGQPQTALELVRAIEVKKWATADDDAKFRIKHYIARGLLLTGRVEEAAPIMVEALTYRPGDEVAVSDAAHGQLIAEDKAEALKITEEALKTLPNSSKVWAVHLQALSDKSMDELQKMVPKLLAETPEVLYALAFIARSKEEVVKSEELIRLAISRAGKDNNDLVSFLAETLLIQVLNGPLRSLPVPLSQKETKKMEEAVDLFRKVIAITKDCQNNEERANWHINCSAALRALDKVDEALQELLEAEKLSDHTLIKTRLAYLYGEKGEIDKSKEILEKIGHSEEDDGTRLIKALDSEAQGKDGEALSRLDHLSDSVSPQIKEGARELRFNIALKKEDYPTAEEIIGELLVEDPTSISVLLMSARLARKKGDRQASLSFADLVKVKLTMDQKAEKALLADAYFQLGVYDEAAVLLRDVLTDNRENSSYMELYLKALYRAAMFEDAMKVAEEVLAQDPSSLYPAHIVIILDHKIDNYEHMLAVINESLRHYPDNKDLLYHKIIALNQLGQKEVAIALVQSIDMAESGSLGQFLRIAESKTMLELFADVVPFLYELRRKNYQTSYDAHRLYFAAVLRGGKDKALAEVLDENRDVIGLNSQFEVDGDGIFIIEDREDEDRKDNELSLDNSYAKQFLGLKAGDEVEMSNGMQSVKKKVLWVTNKYVKAFQDVPDAVDRLFPDRRMVWSIKSSNPEETIAIMKDNAEKKSARAKTILQLYSQGKVTLSQMANALGVSVPEMVRGLGEDRDAGVLGAVHASLPPKLESGIIDSKVAVYDLSTLYLLSRLPIRDKIVGSFDSNWIVRDVLTELDEQVTEKRQMMPMGYFYSIEGQANMQELPEDAQVALLKDHEDLAQWVKDKFQYQPNPGLLRLSKDEEDLLENWPVPFASGVLAADNGALVCIDDYLSRKILEDTCKVPTAGVYELMVRAKEVNAITDEEFEDSVLYLVEKGYQGVVISIETFERAIDKDEGSMTALIGDMATMTQRGGADELTLAAVTFRLQKRYLETHQDGEAGLESLTTILLDTFSVGRDKAVLIEHIKGFIRHHLVGEAVQCDRLLKVVEEWFAKQS